MKTPLLLLGMLIGVTSYAQYSYNLTSYTSDYIPLSGATILTDSDWIEGDSPTWDNPSYSISFDFDFPIGGGTFASTYQYNMYQDKHGAFMGFTHTLYLRSRFGLMDDIADAKAIPDQIPSLISYKTEVTEGNKIAKIQYDDVGFHNEIFGSGTAENRMSFQLWFLSNRGNGNSLRSVEYTGSRTGLPRESGT